MTTFEQLPPDQRATLSLLLRKRKAYAEVGAMLEISPGAVHDRAHAALAVLAPGLARELDLELRAEVGDYLLGQQDEATAQRTRARISSSAAARKWARALAVELVHVTADQLPEIPEASTAQAEPAAAGAQRTIGAQAADDDLAPSRQSVSRRGGLALLGGLVVIVVVVVVLLVSGGKGKSEGGGGGEPSASHSSSKGSTASGRASSSEPHGHLEVELPMSATAAGGSAKGAGAIIRYEGHKVLFVVANGLEPTAGKTFFYSVWLIDPKGQIGPTGYEAPKINAKGELSAIGALPANAADYERIELTRQTSEDAKKPGTVLLEGAFKLH